MRKIINIILAFWQKRSTKNETVSEIRNHFNDLIVETTAEYEKVNEDIKYLESQYETFILKSLESDVDLIKRDIVNIYKLNSSHGAKCNKYWGPRAIDSASMTLYKHETDGGYSGESNRVELVFVHNKELGDKFRVLSIEAKVCGKSVPLSIDRFRGILYKYYASYQIGLSMQKLATSKNTFESLTKILGANLYRDAKIDDILK